jgi:hypothetical protein
MLHLSHSCPSSTTQGPSSETLSDSCGPSSTPLAASFGAKNAIHTGDISFEWTDFSRGSRQPVVWLPSIAITGMTFYTGARFCTGSAIYLSGACPAHAEGQQLAVSGAIKITALAIRQSTVCRAKHTVLSGRIE